MNMRDKLGVLLVSLFLIGSLLPIVYGTSTSTSTTSTTVTTTTTILYGTWDNHYYNALNVSGINWWYTQSYNNGNSIIRVTPASYVLVDVHASRPETFSVHGYDSFGTDRGAVTYDIVRSYGNDTLILVANRTNNKYSFNYLRVYYNPTITQNINNACNPIYTLETPLNLAPYNPPTSINDFCNTYYLDTSPYINGSARRFNLTLSLRSTSSTQLTNRLVVLANKSLTNQLLNISFYPDYQNTFKITNITNYGYNLTNLDFIGGTSSLINPQNLSDNAKLLYNNNIDAYAYEGFFDIVPPQIVSEHLKVLTNTSQMYNATTSKYLTWFGENINSGLFKFALTTNSGIGVTFIPPFTTNYTSNILTNSAPNLTAPIPAFHYRLPINNINWFYNFTTYAFPNSTFHPYPTHIIHFGAGSVGFAILNFTHYAEMGLSCTSLYLKSYGYYNDTLPYYLLNCNSTQVSVLVPNTTVNGYVYNSVYVYYGGGTGGTSSATIYGNYMLGSSSYVNVATPLPFLISLDTPLNLASKINAGKTSVENVYFGYSGTNGQYVYADGCYYGGFSMCTQLFNHATPDTQFIAYKYGTSNIDSIFGKNLSEYFNQNNNYQLTVSNNSWVNSGSLGASLSNATVGIHLSGIIANVHKLATTSYGAGTPTLISLNGTIANSTLPTSPTGLNFSSVFVPRIPLNTTLTIYSNVSLPLSAVLVLSLVLIMLAGFTTINGNIHGLIFGVLALWLLSLWAVSFMVLAIILTIIFIIAEYTKFGEK